MAGEDGLEGMRVLLVEDEFALALGLTDLIADLGADVLGPVASVADALSLIESVPEIDGAILDVNLGTEVVYPVADALLRRQVPFFFATANRRTQLPARFHGVAICEKPFDSRQFRQALRGLPRPRVAMDVAAPAPHA